VTGTATKPPVARIDTPALANLTGLIGPLVSVPLAKSGSSRLNETRS